MRAVISSRHLSISDKLAKEMNALAKKFDIRKYSKIDEIDGILLKRDISVEKKKKILIENLHALIAKTFAINKKKSGNALKPLASRLIAIRKIVLKLRSINSYLETMFLDDLNFLKIKVPFQGKGLKSQNGLLKGELEALEYTAYRLIGRAVMLDKRLLSEYRVKEKEVAAEEKIEVRDIGMVLGKESLVLEHLEAKLPPPEHLTSGLMKEPLFTQWVAGVLALLSYTWHLYRIEAAIFNKLKKNKAAKAIINKKITHLAAERSKLLDIMEEKAASMKKFGADDETKKELRRLTTTINL
ncbi:hypothetical protein HYV80_03360 [Candidatus Woesearchaeota archaeon]|nr:hypothetical protein [Candidatus Woesearchaeota archaeon]